MAGAVPKQAIEKPGFRRRRIGTVALPRLRGVRWLPPSLLVLATLLAICVSYSARPFVRIDLGDYYDSVYLSGFHEREVGASSAATATDWPAAQEELELAGRRPGIWIATVRAAQSQPDDALDSVTLTINGVRMSIARRGPREFVAVIPVEIAGADRLALRLAPALMGDVSPPAGMAGQVTLAPAQTYRWSQGESMIRLPGIGRGDWQVTLTAIVAHPDGAPLDAQVKANGVTIGQLPDRGEARRLALFVPSVLVPDGDLNLSISARTFADPRPLGVLLQDIKVAPAGSGALVPPIGSLGYALVIALCLYFCLLRLLQRPTLAAALALTVMLTLAWALATSRYPTVFMLPRLATLALWSAALLLLLEQLLTWAFQRAGASLSTLALRALLLTFFVGYWIKAGGMLYPYFVGIDVSWHMDRVRAILNGQLGLFYGINSPLNESTMPAAEWGANRPVIPYSPWFHMFATSFALLPMPLVLTAHMFSALVDSSRVFLIALIGRKSGYSERSSLLAALLYAVTPATFLLHSWGNIPTTFGMWWTLLSTAFIVVAYRRLDRAWPFAILTLLLTATLLFYTVMAAFMALFLGLLVVALWLTTRPGERRPIAALALAGVTAMGLATLIYYGQYIPPMIERTIPYFTQAAGAGQGIAGVPHDPFGLYLAKSWQRLGYLRRDGVYGLSLPLLLALPGLLLVRDRRLRAALLCWLAVAVLFLIVGTRISMVDKQVFYIIPALALLAGPLLSRLWSRGTFARIVVVALYAFTLAAALDTWVYRIASVRQ